MKYKLFFVTFFAVLGVSLIITLIANSSFNNLDDILFGISLFTFFLSLFKLMRDKGAYDIISYSWHKSKRIFFFLPKYKYEANAEEEEKNKTFNSFVKYRRTKNWKNTTQIIFAALLLVIISIIMTMTNY